MNKLLKTILVFVLAAVLIVTGVFAAKNYTFTTDSTITFAGDGAPVQIQGVITCGLATNMADLDTRNYETLGDGRKKPRSWTTQSWSLGEVLLNSGDFAFAFTLTITNHGTKPITVNVKRPTSLHANLRLSGSIGDTSTGTGVGTIDSTQLNGSGVTTYKYLLVLTDYSQNIETQSFSFEVSFTTT